MQRTQERPSPNAQPRWKQTSRAGAASIELLLVVCLLLGLAVLVGKSLERGLTSNAQRVALAWADPSRGEGAHLYDTNAARGAPGAQGVPRAPVVPEPGTGDSWLGTARDAATKWGLRLLRFAGPVAFFTKMVDSTPLNGKSIAGVELLDDEEERVASALRAGGAGGMEILSAINELRKQRNSILRPAPAPTEPDADIGFDIRNDEEALLVHGLRLAGASPEMIHNELQELRRLRGGGAPALLGGGAPSLTPPPPGGRASDTAAPPTTRDSAGGNAPDASNAARRADGPSPTRRWSRPVDFEDTRVYQRNDLIDPARVDRNGRTNLERMQAGRAPLDANGNSIELHHMLQTQRGPLAEVTREFHDEYSRQLHINPSTTPSGIDRKEFNNYRSRYWRNRARDFAPPRARARPRR